MSRDHCKQIRGDEERVYAGIIRRPKGGMNQSYTSGRVATPFERWRVNRVVSGSFKRVRTSILLSLLLAKSLHNAFVRLHPVGMKTRSVTCCFPESVGESHRITERINLPLALAQLRAHR